MGRALTTFVVLLLLLGGEFCGGAVAEDVWAVDYYDGLRAWDMDQKELALSIWTSSASWGDARSMGKMSELYETGKSLPEDIELAYYWITIAAKRDNKFADRKAKLGSKLEDSSRKQLEEMAERWTPQRFEESFVEQASAAFGAAAGQSGAKKKQQNQTNSSGDGNSDLLLAIAQGKSSSVERILSSGGDPNASSSKGELPIFYAAAAGNSEVIRTLLSAGATASVQDKRGMWPYQIAEQQGHSEASGLLKTSAMAEMADAITYLDLAGYLPKNLFEDVTARRNAIKAYQQAQNLSSQTGIIDQQTLSKLKRDAKQGQELPYIIVVRGQRDDQWKYWNFSGQYKGISEARDAGNKFCSKKGIDNCKVNFAPKGTCVAVARSNASQPRVSAVSLNEASASKDAEAQCQKEATDCKVVLTLCAS